MGKHPIGGMRSQMVRNSRADERYRKKAYLRNKEKTESDERLEQLRKRLGKEV